MFHSFFFSSLARSGYLYLFSLSINFTLWSTGQAKYTIRPVLFFIIIISISLLASFSRQFQQVGFQWILVDGKSSHISWTLQSILVDLIGIMGWMIPINHQVSISSIPFFIFFSGLFQGLKLRLISLSRRRYTVFFQLFDKDHNNKIQLRRSRCILLQSADRAKCLYANIYAQTLNKKFYTRC